MEALIRLAIVELNMSAGRFFILQDIDFVFNCVESSDIAKVTVYVTSIPMPSKKHKRIAAELVMIPGKNITVTVEQGYS